MRGPGIAGGSVVNPMVRNTDLAPTLAELAGVTPPAFVDGRSFRLLLDGRQAQWRQSFLIERRQFEPQLTYIARQAGVSEEGARPGAAFDSLRWGDMGYLEYGTGERELYDLAADLRQLSNVAAEADPALLAALSARVAELAACTRAECRRLEDLPVGPDLRLADTAATAPAAIAN
jgi:N-acetylglucosamine-6-sulfatase